MHGQQPNPKGTRINGLQPMGSQEEHERMSSRGTSENWVLIGQLRKLKLELKIGQFGSISPVVPPMHNCTKLTGKVRQGNMNAATLSNYVKIGHPLPSTMLKKYCNIA